jgi:hypothetical protein
LSPHGCEIQRISATSLHPIQGACNSLTNDTASQGAQNGLPSLISNSIPSSAIGTNRTL